MGTNEARSRRANPAWPREWNGDFTTPHVTYPCTTCGEPCTKEGKRCASCGAQAGMITRRANAAIVAEAELSRDVDQFVVAFLHDHAPGGAGPAINTATLRLAFEWLLAEQRRRSYALAVPR